jgi:hypothetical protein
MRKSLVALSLLACGVVFGQTGTITGTLSDPSGAVVANAAIQIKNLETGVVYPTTTTDTGNYSMVQLPIGQYEVSATLTGFKKATRSGLTLGTAQVMRIDLQLEVGSAGDTVTVTAEASLLKTENGELAHEVTIHQLDNLPILGVNGGGINSSSSGFRDPFSLAQLIPGTTYVASSTMTVNGMTNSEQIRVEGQTSGNLGGLSVFTHQTQPSVDAIQEVAVQTSNYAAEFGTVGGGIFNVTMKSGTNQYHGTLYDYSVNEIMNAAQPYTGLKSAQRRHDYGGTLGGPLSIPKVYNGKNKTFFFWNYEQYRENTHVNNTATVPIQAYRDGNFAPLITASGVNGVPRNVQVSGADYKDPLGRTIQSGTIFDQNTTRTVVVNGANVQVRDPYPNNAIPITRFDPVAVKILALVPQPIGPNAASGLIGNNYQNPWLSHRTSQIPSVKVDHTINDKQHISYYWGETVTESQFSFPNGNSVGLPLPIDPARGTFIYSPTHRVNYDYTIKPTLLLHFGAGYSANNFGDYAPVLDYNAEKSLGLKGATVNRNFPNFTTAGTQALGGMQALGPAGGIQSTSGTEHRPSASVSVSLVRSNHNYKAGFEWRYEQYPTQVYTGSAGQYYFGSQLLPLAPQGGTSQISLNGVTTSQGTTGFQFAEFLLGNVSAVSLAVPADYRQQKQQYGIFLQDSWKLTRKLTLDYGLRWDYGTYAREQYGRSADFNPTVPNASAGGHSGGSIFEATCNCNFASNYPYAIAPRFGMAYQINNKTVFRGGFGVVYSATSVVGGSASNTANGGTAAFGQWLFQLKDGIPASVQPQWPVYASNVGLPNGAVGTAATLLDGNAGRPARQYQWSVGIQRELSRNLVAEVTYVGNRVYWVQPGLGQALSPGANDISVALLQKDGFTIGNAADRLLLTTPYRNLTASQLAVLNSRGIGIPYAGFDTSQTVRQMIRPFPQFSGALQPSNSPVGRTWYDSLQVTVNKRLSHGLSLNANYTFSKTLAQVTSIDVYNPAIGKNLATSDLPHQFRLSAEYTTPRLRSGPAFLTNRVVANILADWGMGWFLQYQSAPILGRPTSSGADPISNYLGRGPGSAQLVPGQSLWTTDWTDLNGVHHTDPLDINCHCFDPTKTLVLNKAAWANVPDGQWAADTSSIRYFRGFRYPQENLNITRTFRIKERYNFMIRAEWSNVFNRLRLPQPTSAANFSSAPTQSGGLYSGGFGTIVPTAGTSGQRSGQLIARFQF